MTCQSLLGVGEGEGEGFAAGDGDALAEDFAEALDLGLDLDFDLVAASEVGASDSARRPAMAKEQSRRPIILYKVQEKCHKAIAFQLEIGRQQRVQKSWSGFILETACPQAVGRRRRVAVRHEGVPAPIRDAATRLLDNPGVSPFLHGC